MTAGAGENPPRLFITKMVLENFKSYGGEREVGPFHKRFSSIVGPNGSGKSNVIDAMLFVFGKKAKKLRLNKVGFRGGCQAHKACFSSLAIRVFFISGISCVPLKALSTLRLLSGRGCDMCVC